MIMIDKYLLISEQIHQIIFNINTSNVETCRKIYDFCNKF